MIFKTKKKEVHYLDKSFSKVVVIFIKIKMAYIKYNTSFSFKSKLYKHLKTSGIEII